MREEVCMYDPMLVDTCFTDILSDKKKRRSDIELPQQYV